MVEAVRLVVWDLDDTFWKGTVTEGGIEEYLDANHSLVIELARRGIMSSICSKNDFDVIKNILVEKGIWDYFIFPSIDWLRKGPRVADIISSAQLRAESVVFIDDNPMNRAEVLEEIPGIRVEDETYVEGVLNDPLYKGKEDHNLSRLKQYKILEKKQTEKKKSGSDNLSFLRASGIVVTMNYDVEDNIDRAVELINRTNQLNFTKNRLSPDPEIAREELRKQLNDIPYARAAALVHVKDNYGDYGYCGFYLKETFHEKSFLIHFCFSCRILGMGVETWLYQRLSSPELSVSGEVLTDVKKNTSIDWINNKAEVGGKKSVTLRDNKVVFRGGCDLDAVAHYFRDDFSSICSETNYVHDGSLIRRDSIVNIITGLDGLSGDNLSEIEKVGFREDDFSVDFVKECKAGDILVLSIWGDTVTPSYRHKEKDLAFMMLLQGVYINYAEASDELIDATVMNVNANEKEKEKIAWRVKHIRDNYESFFYDSSLFKEGIRKVMSLLDEGTKVVLLKPNLRARSGDGTLFELPSREGNREDIDKICMEYKNLFAVDIMDCITSDDEIIDIVHFGRMVYYRIYQEILSVVSK